ncbi:MAG: hypothetical protein HWN65_16340 [Candidatus Helarchaeota archaeon]|nr:hypothetical protein [Candidatus Helarchaeota archaeon]
MAQKKKDCSDELTIPIKLIIEGENLLNISRCPECHETYEFNLPMRDKDQWLPLIAEPFFQCDLCGTVNDDTWHISGGESSLTRAKPLEIVTICKECGKTRTKVISQALWNDVSEGIKEPSKAIRGVLLARKVEEFLLATMKDKMVQRLSFEDISNHLDVPRNKIIAIAESLILEGKLAAKLDLSAGKIVFLDAIEEEAPPPVPELIAEEAEVPAEPDRARDLLQEIDEMLTELPPSKEAKEETPPIIAPLVEQGPPSDELGSEIEAEVEVPADLTKYQEITHCVQETCAGSPLIPKKLTLKGDVAQLITQCLRCPNSYKVLLPLSEKDQWLPLLTEGLFQCERCGTLNDDNFTYSQTLRKVKTVTRCKNCGKKYGKVISKIFWEDLVPAAKKLPTPPPPPLEVAPPPPIEADIRPRIYTVPLPPARVETPPTWQVITETLVEERPPVITETLVEERPPVAVTYRKIAYENFFDCKKCGSSQMAVQKIKAEEQQRVKVRAKCADCGKTKQFSLPLSHIQAWLSHLAPSFFRCALCGSSCQIKQTQKSDDTMKVTFYCEKDWLEFQKEIPLPLFQAVMTQIQKAVH